MAIISVNKPFFSKGYSSSQFRYAMIYVVITLVVLVLLNFYCSHISQMLFYQSKETSMIEKCQLAANDIATLEVINGPGISQILSQMDSLKVTRMLVTDHTGKALYDSIQLGADKYAMLPEILTALEGNDVFTSRYHDGAITSRAATPIVYYGSIIGCVYMTEYDTALGALIQSLQITVLRITAMLEIVLILFAVVFSNTFSRRMRKIMRSMRIIQEGDYSHKVEMGGNDELTVLGNEFNDLTERLRNSEQKRARFVSDASHELKTPLASIKLLSDSILQNDMDLDTVREFVGDIGNEADRLNRMTSKLLSLTKLDGRTDTESEIIYMAPTIRRVVRMLTPMARQAEISIEVDCSQDSPVLILEDDLYQIVFNLMENGIKYNIAGGKLMVKLLRREDNALLTVTDTGSGIPQDAIPHLFERFYRVDKARARATGGSGLGLAIVRSIVQKNRGEITVESVLDQGTTFTVSFPAFDTEVDKE